MTRDTIQTIALCTGLAVAGAVAWWVGFQPSLTVHADSLQHVPESIAGWTSQDLPIDATVESVLQADQHLQRAYIHPSGELIWVYVGYYGTNRGGRPEHTPRGCYTGAGWGIGASRVVDLERDGSLRANEYQVHRDGEQRLVHFWYRSHQSTGMLGGWDLNLDKLSGRLLHGRADGALMRISTSVRNDDVVAARGRLMSFAAAFDRAVAGHWPEERPKDS